MFIPPHCPNPDCEHYDSPTVQDWYGSIGQYSTKTFGTVPRFKCRSCRLGFSKQTFSIDYYAKRRLDYSYIYHKINDGAGLRKIGRDLHASCDSITNRINRMARNATLANRQIVNLLPLREDLVLDGLQNFCNSQFFPDNYTIAVGKDSQFVYECDYATIRRAGRMTTAQKKRREELEKHFRASRQSIEKSFTRVLRSISMKAPKREIPLILYTDEKSDYRRSMWNDKQIREKMFSGQWRHHMTNSKVGRNTRNPLFSVNYIDREIRKDMASQTRETVQFPRNVANAMLRMNLYLFDHNIFKPYRIRDEAEYLQSHAEAAGLERQVLEGIAGGFFTLRFFKPRELKLSESAQRTISREWKTPLKVKDEVKRRYLAA
jgi:transposase-like protein